MYIALHRQLIRLVTEVTYEFESGALRTHIELCACIAVAHREVIEAHLLQRDRRSRCGCAVGLPDQVVLNAVAIETGIQFGALAVYALHTVVTIEQVPQVEFEEEFLREEQRVGRNTVGTQLVHLYIVQPHARHGEPRYEREVHVAHGHGCEQALVQCSYELHLHLGLVHAGQYGQRGHAKHQQGGEHEEDLADAAEHG